MIRYAVLGSGSSGNAYIIGTDTDALLIDAGFSFRQLRLLAEQAGFDFSTVRGLCITHLHPDHSRGAGVFARKTGLPVYIHTDLVTIMHDDLYALRIPEGQIIPFDHQEAFTAGPFHLNAFRTSHDSPASVGFSCSLQGRIFTILTDTGMLDETMQRHALDADILFLEANYDEQMLDGGPYPVFLKRRIRGTQGHLSNTDAINLLNQCSANRLAQVYFCHLSKINNHPDVLAHQCATTLRWPGRHVICEHGNLYSDAVQTGDTLYET